jgi:hypothetical protein
MIMIYVKLEKCSQILEGGTINEAISDLNPHEKIILEDEAKAEKP